MKVCKPLKLPLLTRVLEVVRKPHFHVTTALAFPLKNPRALLDEFAFWAAIGPALGTSLFDESLTKARGELLVAGRFFAPGGNPTPAGYVRAKVGSLEKRLAVLGDREWKHGVATSPLPMTEMPIDWAHAFGGLDYAQNPYGIGATSLERDGAQIHPLPNIERYGALLRSPSEKPEPDCFLPMDLAFEQRRLRAGTYGFDYVEKYAPGLPPDHDPMFFNAAREDQWISGMWRGDEPILVENMSPSSPTVESQLPGLHTRVFVTQRTPDGDHFFEIQLRCDTVWLFPSAGIGAVVFHGSILVADDDAADIVHLVAACEESGGRRPIEHYRGALERRLTRGTAALAEVSDRDLMPPRESGVVGNMDLGPIGQWVKSERIGEQNARRGADRHRQKMKEMMIADGVDPALMGFDQPLPPMEPSPPTDDLDALADYLVEQDERIKQIEAEAVTRKEAYDERTRAMHLADGHDPGAAKEPPVGGPPIIDTEQRIREFERLTAAAREAGTPNLALEEMLATPAFAKKLADLDAMKRQTYLQGAHLMPAARPMTEEATIHARVLIEAARDSGEPLIERDLTGADLRGVSLAGMDFRGSFLEGADLRGADLRGASFDGAVLARADLRGANLERTKLVGANLGLANLETANLASADLTGATLMGARLSGARFVGATLSKAEFLEVDWSGVDVRNARMEGCTFLKSDLSNVVLVNAHLVRAVFVECTLDGADLSGADIQKATFVTTHGRRVKFTGANARESVFAYKDEFIEADFSDAILERACLRTTTFTRAHFERARLTMSDLSECDLTGAVLDRATLNGALLIRARMEGASFRGCNLTESNLSKSRLAGADFADTQLTRADFSRARGDKHTTFNDAVVKYTRFDKEMAG